MPFIPISNLSGKLYIPEPEKNSGKKHPCPDCAFCQMCSDERCILCRRHIDERKQ